MNEFATSDFDDSEPGGSTFDQNTVIDLAGQKNLSNDNSDFIALNNPAGNTSQNYVQPGAYSVDASGKYTGLTNLDSVKKFVSDNKELFGLAGAAAGMMSPGAQYGKTGYQGSIPQLLATRKMVSAPPTRAQGYRPGAGGINYGGDVTYSALPAGDKIWSQLSGNTGTTAGANLTPIKTDTSNAGAITNLVTNTGNKTDTAQTVIPYFKLNPDVAASYAKDSLGMTPEQFANAHWQKYGKNEQRISPDGVTPEVLNSNILKWIAANPNASAADITDVMRTSGVNTQDVAKALAGDNTMSAGKEYAILNNMGLDTLSKNIINEQAQGYTPEQKATLLEKAGLTQADVDAANKYSADTGYKGTVQAAVPTNNMEDSIRAFLAQQNVDNKLDTNKVADVVDTNTELGQSLANLGLNTQDPVAQPPIDKAEATDYFKPSYDNTDYSYMQFAEGGMAQGRYLQGGTDGMADEIPAQIGQDQPAALSHGEFVIPADVVSHMGNGNSDAGAKKLYQMMDKIRMARTGNKKQGKKINPDKFMPGGLAAAYAAGGKVKKYETGGSVITNPGIAGVESSLSNWAGDYTTNMLGQGQALANMPYQQYMGPLTAGPSSLQNKVFEGLEKTTFPSNLGGTFSSAGAYAPPTMGSTVGSVSTPSAGGTPITASQPAASTGIASQYMNPYLQSVLTPQMDEMRRQSQINLQPALGKLTQAGGLGGGRQAIMESEANRNLLQEQNKTLGQGYAAAYDKGMQQFNTEQAQAKGLADLLSTQGGIQRGIESEGIAADKSAFEEARANPYKMVQFQQSLLQGLPLEAKSYTGIQQSDLVKAAQGATTVNQLLKNLGLIT